MAHLNLINFNGEFEIPYHACNYQKPKYGALSEKIRNLLTHVLYSYTKV